LCWLEIIDIEFRRNSALLASGIAASTRPSIAASITGSSLTAVRTAQLTDAQLAAASTSGPPSVPPFRGLPGVSLAAASSCIPVLSSSAAASVLANTNKVWRRLSSPWICSGVVLASNPVGQSSAATIRGGLSGLKLPSMFSVIDIGVSNRRGSSTTSDLSESDTYPTNESGA